MRRRGGLHMSQKRIAVLGIKGLPSKGGGERVAEAIINAAVDDGFQVTVYGKKGYCERKGISRRIDLVTIRDVKGKHLSAFSFGLISAFHALLFGKYDLIHLHYADFGYIVPLLKLRYKVIGTSHGAEYNRGKWNSLAKLFFKMVEVLFVKYTDICTSVSKPLADYYRDQYGKEIIYIPNGIYIDPSQSEVTGKTLQRYGLQKRGYILFAAGRIIPSKGCDLLLKANREVDPDIPLVVIGDRDGDKQYKAYLDSLSSPNVVFIDFIGSKGELYELVENCRFFVFPSAYEAMSIMLLEVASLKRGIVCSDIPENLEAVAHCAVYFRSGDHSHLAQKIIRALESPSEMDRLGDQAYEWVKENRNWHGITERYMALYDSI
jgi:glycosyltransferase involved in cell wall biosynthesis